MTTATATSPEVGAHRGERAVVAGLRTELTGIGSYDDVSADVDASNEWYAENLSKAKDYVSDHSKGLFGKKIKVGEAVDVVVVVTKPYLDDVFREEQSALGVSAGTDEWEANWQEYIKARRENISGTISPEDSESSEKSGFIRSMTSRFSGTCKETRKAFSHYRAKKEELRLVKTSGSDMTRILEEKKTARNHLVGQFSKASGFVAMAGFVGLGVKNKGLDVSGWFEDKGDVLRAVAIGVAYPSLWTSSLGGWKETRINEDKLSDEKKTELEADKESLKVKTHALDTADEWIKAREDEDDFDAEDDEYKAGVEYRNSIDDERDALWDQMNAEYGDRKFTRKAKIVGAAALAAGAFMAYHKIRYGGFLPFGEAPAVDTPTTGGNGSEAGKAAGEQATSTPPTTGGSGSSAGGSVPAAPSGNGSNTGNAAPVPTGGSGSKENFNQSVYDKLPSGDHKAKYDAASPAERLAFNNFANASKEQLEAFDKFADGVEYIQASPANAGKTPDQINKIVELTSSLAEQRANFGGTPPNPALLAQFDYNFSQLEKVEEAMANARAGGVY